MKNVRRIGFLVVTGFILAGGYRANEPEKEWRHYHGSPTSNKYSVLDQINKDNVATLEVAWTYHFPTTERSADVKCNPLMVNGTVYGTTAAKNLVALDAGTGEERWYLDFRQFDSTGRQHSARGIHYWEKGEDQRIFYVYDQYLYAVDAKTGHLVKSFGRNGRIHFSQGIEVDEDRWIRLTTPGVIYQDLIITGSFVSERLPSAPGHIRAFSTLTGEVEWIFHTIPKPGEYGYDTWPEGAYQTVGGANNWGGMSLDEERGIVYVPTGSPTYDFYGANRSGQNLFANCLLALDAATGERIWHYQMVHHDLWDRDLPCAPNLLTVTHHGQRIDAVAQPTKQGYVFLFNRVTGKPLFDIREMPVPASTMEGEETWPTQPVPVKPPPFTRTEFTADQITDLSPGAHAHVTQELKKYTTAPFTPPDTTGVILQPGFSGGASWGGGAIDEEKATLIINANDVPGLLTLYDQQAELAAVRLEGASLYQVHCASCHGKNREGSHYYPSLVGIEQSMSRRSILQMIRHGGGMMPAMDYIPDDQKSAIVSYLLGEETDPEENSSAHGSDQPSTTLRYAHRGYEQFEDQDGYPAIKPPWATLTAIDLNKGEITWQQPLGEDEALTEQGIPPTGVDNLGGPIVTAGGLVFIAATWDNKFRAFDKDTGALLWEYELPGQGAATPSTYAWQGTQYVVIAVTDHEERGFVGGYTAFKLPD